MAFFPLLSQLPRRTAGPSLPSALDGVASWSWRVHASLGAFQDAGTTPCTADGQSVKQLNDQSGNGVTLSWFASGTAPLFKLYSGLLFVVRFTAGSATILQNASVNFATNNANPISYVVVYRSIPATNGHGLFIKDGNSTGGLGLGYGSGNGDTGSGVNTGNLLGLSEGQAWRDYGGLVQTTGCAVFTYDGAGNYKLYRNNNTPTNFPSVAYINATGGFSLGGYVGNTTPGRDSTFDLCESAACASVLTPTQVGTITSAATSIWGV